jgi:hypothetical protein
MRASAQRAASARLAAMPAVTSASSVARSAGPSLAEVLFHPGRLRRAALAWEDPQVQFPRLDQRMVTVVQQRELRNCACGETLRRLSIDHPLDAVCRRRLHLCLRI